MVCARDYLLSFPDLQTPPHGFEDEHLILISMVSGSFEALA
jgi:hypothetical protein